MVPAEISSYLCITGQNRLGWVKENLEEGPGIEPALLKHTGSVLLVYLTAFYSKAEANHSMPARHSALLGGLWGSSLMT